MANKDLFFPLKLRTNLKIKKSKKNNLLFELPHLITSRNKAQEIDNSRTLDPMSKTFENNSEKENKDKNFKFTLK